MRMKIDVTLDYALESPGPALLLIEAAGVHGQILNRTNIDLGQPLKLARVPAEEGIGERIVMRLQDRLTCRYSAEVQVTRPRPDLASLQAVEVEDMPGDALRYLLPSRYCQSERFGHFTGSRFEGLTGGPLVAAMRDWVERNLDYVAGTSDGDTTAADTFLDRRGVCRDYAHLLIALCRAQQIPARIASVYAPHVQPQDFHVVVQVYLGGDWHLVDPTGMAHADQMALVAVGRDAADVAFLTTNSVAELRTQSVEVMLF
ncbi:transglutaminase family protein [Paracoccus marcusii]|uniref:transglutaminase-like domain-containing protein n=1 Tax=Paracoccus marcusii TaxID=59779 RepID=UPI00326361C4